MTRKDIQNRLFNFKRTALALSLILLPGCVLHWFSSFSLVDAISLSTLWLVPGLAYLYLFCSSLAAVQCLLVFLLPFGRMHSTGFVAFCWLWPITIPMFWRFNKRLDAGTNS